MKESDRLEALLDRFVDVFSDMWEWWKADPVGNTWSVCLCIFMVRCAFH